MTAQNLAADMEIAGACIDILSMNTIEASFGGNATYIGSTGLCLYSYDLPNNAVNDWMVAQHVTRNIMPNGQYFLTYRVPELFTASAFATAQFLVDVTNEVADLNTDSMINYLESGVTINCPKGETYLRPEDHQGLAEMYIATAVNDTASGSETENLIIAELVQTLNRTAVAPPVASDWNGAPYVPGSFGPTTPPPFEFDLLTVGLIGGGALILGIVIAAVIFRKK